MCREVAALCKTTLSRSIVSPKPFIALCKAGQQDVHEFLWKILVPALQEEMNPAKQVKRNDTWNSDQTWSWYKRYNTNIIDELFGGLYKGSVTCKQCGYVSTTYDPFLEISLPVVGHRVNDCLRQELDSEEMNKGAGYKCLSCKKVTGIKKTVQIDRPPKYLILHLKRLVNGRKKISYQIDYEKHLDISKHCVNAAKKVQYELVAVCIHNGGPQNGHYYAVGKRGNNVFYNVSM
eukprot:TRINITY_DN2325_c0_g3_i6.p1 TRINITY_DN2325_c0_g3~~TRINITY_DN2325_c0_g3_i6.p1  ORF type:complete len:234 (+),score=54.49 TRINITY_DN2325_c0_g3_i6:119-820(+)